MENHDQRFEEFLREFAPSRPRAWPETRVANPWHWQRLAAAAIVIIACGSGSWFAGSHYVQSPASTSEQSTAQAVPVTLVMSAAYLQRLALEDPAQFDAALAAAAQTTLPRFDGPHSALGLLAKD